MTPKIGVWRSAVVCCFIYSLVFYVSIEVQMVSLIPHLQFLTSRNYFGNIHLISELWYRRVHLATLQPIKKWYNTWLMHKAGLTGAQSVRQCHRKVIFCRERPEVNKEVPGSRPPFITCQPPSSLSLSISQYIYTLHKALTLTSDQNLWTLVQ